MLSIPNRGNLSTPYPGTPALAKASPNPVVDRMVSNINHVVNAIRRHKLLAQTSAQRIIECECELTALTRAAETLGFRLEIDEQTGLRRLSTGHAMTTDPIVAP